MELRSPSGLDSLGFLIGHFRGEGKFSSGGAFAKEVVGSWEVAGRFLSLRMVASYHVGEEIDDVHHAMVLVGRDPKSREIAARAFTDGGAVVEYRLLVDGDRVTFDDRVPHEVRAQRARKTLERTAEGWREILELDHDGAGKLEPYSVVEMRPWHEGVPGAAPLPDRKGV